MNMKKNNNKSVKNKFVTDVLVRGVTQVVVALKGVIFLPIISKNLGASQYGIWSQIMITSSLLVPILMLDLREANVRYLGSEENDEKPSIFSSLLGFVWLILLVSLVIFNLFDNQLANVLFDDRTLTPFVKLFLLYLFSRTTFRLIHTYYRANNKIKQHSLIQVLQTVTGIGIVSFLITLGNFELREALITLVSIDLFLSLLMLVNIFNNLGLSLKINFKKLKKYLKYSIPLIPTVALYWVINSSDRLVIVHFLNLSEVARYSAAYRVGQILKFLLSPISFTLLPLVSNLWEEREFDKARQYLANSLKYYILVAVPGLAGIYWIGPILLEKLTTTEFSVNRVLIFYIGLGFFFIGVYQIYVYVIYLHEKNKYLPGLFLVVGGVNLGLNLFLVPKIGITGAALATLISYSLQCLIIFTISFKMFQIKVNFVFLIKVMASSIVMFFVIRFFVPTNPLEIFGLIALGILIYIMLMIVIGGLGKKELRLFKSLFRI